MGTAEQIIIDVLLYFTRNRFEKVANAEYYHNASAVKEAALHKVASEVFLFFKREQMDPSYTLENQHMLGRYKLSFRVDRRVRAKV